MTAAEIYRLVLEHIDDKWKTPAQREWERRQRLAAALIECAPADQVVIEIGKADEDETA